MAKPLVLIGPMGAGKSTLGRKLAKLLETKFLDTDRMISASHGPIPKIFEDQGEDRFRTLETAALEKALKSPAVIATGGGVVVTKKNRELLQDIPTIFLDTSADWVLSRINLDKRPLLKSDPSMWEMLYQERLGYYQQLATATVVTANRPIRVVLEELESKARDVL
ncbi:MAG: shikimate kinase [Candidatus Aquiluna sp. XM-24bin5]|nr:MAG: shikimate kinase [Candidatus Aquiluna sp. XM-24bin5]